MQKTAYEMRISDCSSDVCSSDLVERQANDEADDGLRGDELAQCFEIGGEFPAEDRLDGGREAPPCVAARHADRPGADVAPRQRSDESRVGKEWGSTCSFRVWQYLYKNQQTNNSSANSTKN